MIKAQIQTKWIGDGTPQAPYTAEISDVLKVYTDVTAQTSSDIDAGLQPNSLVVEIETDADTFALIEDDDRFYIMWSIVNG